MPSSDPEKLRAQWRAASAKRYRKNPNRFKVENTVRRVVCQTRNKAYVDNIKSTNPCTDCGRMYPSYVMQFDHISDDKLFNIADLVSAGRNFQSLLNEISKCELVCANCHLERTHHRRVEKRLISLAS